MSGLRVNLEKSKLVLVRRVDIVADLAQEWLKSLVARLVCSHLLI